MIEKITHSPNLIYPDTISQDRITFLTKIKRITANIASVDLEMVKMKLQDSDEGLGWTFDQCEEAEIEYKRFLNLCLKYGKGIVPNKVMDQMWHYHILDTLAYHQDCEKVFGGYMHHYPYFGMRGSQDARNLADAFEKTKDLYLELFDEEMVREDQNKCWHDCQNRCWHACSSK
ncbi:glycine-rich domain-containing protein [Microscilla marina]|uniref:Glycine-rich domain-containing protein-like n=1 Tax=Microscilla marina ATCC 23134 TaxID=313606 RepID=A1ZVA9_MICM2|nr:hypothetical protein [Microscilla marina]EAY25607.1 conserved hypothetical protein [Microscilla marina ATCC 23134]